METPVEIEFQGMQATPPIRQSISTHVEKLENRFGRITACRIVVKAPTAHHQTGAPYNVHIRLALPDGREVNVGVGEEYPISGGRLASQVQGMVLAEPARGQVTHVDDAQT